MVIKPEPSTELGQFKPGLAQDRVTQEEDLTLLSNLPSLSDQLLIPVIPSAPPRTKHFLHLFLQEFFRFFYLSQHHYSQRHWERMDLLQITAGADEHEK